MIHGSDNHCCDSANTKLCSRYFSPGNTSSCPMNKKNRWLIAHFFVKFIFTKSSRDWSWVYYRERKNGQKGSKKNTESIVHYVKNLFYSNFSMERIHDENYSRGLSVLMTEGDQNDYMNCAHANGCQVRSWSSKPYRIVRNVRIWPNVTFISLEVITNTGKDPIPVKWFLNRGQTRSQTDYNFLFYSLCIVFFKKKSGNLSG